MGQLHTLWVTGRSGTEDQAGNVHLDWHLPKLVAGTSKTLSMLRTTLNFEIVGINSCTSTQRTSSSGLPILAVYFSAVIIVCTSANSHMRLRPLSPTV